MIDKKTGSADSGLSKGSVDAVYHKIDEQIDLFIF
ncbi:hypothetical protein J2Z44_001575 [Clostridium punense]|uniref:Uncharacterized protein n=1 Tax=Clostridium punense TaxID=1054297 RepID=A0ABS4K1X9_9CLOT|nr:hypothetical protein [Clostridium punense]